MLADALSPPFLLGHVRRRREAYKRPFKVLKFHYRWILAVGINLQLYKIGVSLPSSFFSSLFSNMDFREGQYYNSIKIQ